MKINSIDMRHRILRIVNYLPNAANDDKLLIAKIWEEEGWDYMDSLYSNLRRVSSPETIRRTRQKLVAEGLIKVSDKTTEKRYNLFKKVREII